MYIVCLFQYELYNLAGLYPPPPPQSEVTSFHSTTSTPCPKTKGKDFI